MSCTKHEQISHFATQEVKCVNLMHFFIRASLIIVQFKLSIFSYGRSSEIECYCENTCSKYFNRIFNKICRKLISWYCYANCCWIGIKQRDGRDESDLIVLIGCVYFLDLDKSSENKMNNMFQQNCISDVKVEINSNIAIYICILDYEITMIFFRCNYKIN